MTFNGTSRTRKSNLEPDPAPETALRSLFADFTLTRDQLGKRLSYRNTRLSEVLIVTGCGCISNKE
ncbi:MAG: hypothetical protein M1830_001846 [Pleopsidium flavum]|nr:MAG: hypothetical protein M1830_001846 [Pleopsidium flavum]